jgi:flavin reductase (DIM6/NTAB) family NADH-FMN oxidoreductase RutF
VPRDRIDTSEFRKTMGCFATGVTVVTAVARDGSDIGLTVNSFNSLSLDPPLVLWSLGVGSPLMQAFEHASHFAVNVLAEDQVEISQRFALRAVDKFSDLKLRTGLGGAPLLPDCVAWLECRRQSAQRHGDHMLFIGAVERMEATDRRPLLFLHSHYATAGERVIRG